MMSLALLVLAKASIGVLELPKRRPGAISGAAFAQQVAPLSLEDREQRIWEEVSAGNVPDFLRRLVRVPLASGGLTGAVFVTPDYLAVGSDSDYVLMPMTPYTAQRIADRCHCVLPTPSLVDAIYRAATIKLDPAPIPPSPEMTTVPVFVRHSEAVRTQRAGKAAMGELVVGDKKDIVVCKGLVTNPGRVAIYGWHKADGQPIQPLYMGHFGYWADYSHGVRLVSDHAELSGKPVDLHHMLRDPQVSQLVSSEGPLTRPRYRFRVFPHPDDPTIHPPVDEQLTEFNPVAGVRVLVDSPKNLKHDVDLIVYALPNGNTIEQTYGRKLRPDDDWHYDIQHIGAQTRFLRRRIVDRSLVVAYVENSIHAWPAWLKAHPSTQASEIIDSIAQKFRESHVHLTLVSHSGGGALIFSYLSVVSGIPENISRIAFIDSDYNYEAKQHAVKLTNWLLAGDHTLCVLAYDDASALLNGKPFVSANGGTWGRSHAMRNDMPLIFNMTTSLHHDLERIVGLDGRVQFFFLGNPKRAVLHTVQVELNGFIESILAGTKLDEKGYRYLGKRAYSSEIMP